VASIQGTPAPPGQTQCRDRNHQEKNDLCAGQSDDTRLSCIKVREADENSVEINSHLELLSGRGLATPNPPEQETNHKITPHPPR
jgi:hypothetical protein